MTRMVREREFKKEWEKGMIVTVFHYPGLSKKKYTYRYKYLHSDMTDNKGIMLWE